MIDNTEKSADAISHIRTSFRRKKLIAAMISLGLLTTLGDGLTQQAVAQEDTGFDAGFTIEEILITARKRQESLQDAPLSVAAFTGESLEQRGFNDVSEISQLVPNLIFDIAPPISGNQSAAAVFIRGIGQLDFTINVDPGVGTYIDGVYVARSVGGVIDLLDLERVEILRGPQGTLFGRNTIGGAVQLITRAPEEEFGGYGSVTLGTDSRVDVLGVVNVPFSDTVRSKFSVLSRNRDGYVTDGTGSDLGNDDSIATRFQLVWEPTDRLDFAFAFDATRDRENGAPNVALNLYSNTPIPLRTNTAAQGEAALQGCTPAIFDTSRLCFGPAWLTGDRNRTESTFPAKSENDIYGVSFTVNYEIPWGDFKSITAYRDMDSQFQRDSDHSPFNVFATINDQEQDQFSQEFQLVGDSFQNTLHWVSGLYYFTEEATELTQVILPNANPASGTLIRGIFNNEVENSNWAVYGEATYDFTERLHLTLGARYTDETKEYITNQVFVPNATLTPVLVTLVDDPGSSSDFTETTSRATLSYDIGDQLMTYATYSEGFKSGGFNPRYLAPAPNLKAIPFDPEYVTSYEVGFKFINDSNTLRVNGALFVNDYDDIQISTNPDFTGGATITQNAAQAEISGGELEFTFAPNAEWLFEGGLGYLNARYDQLDPAVQFGTNNDFARIPEWSGNFAASYIYELGSGASIIPRLDVAYKSEMEGSAENNPDVFQDEYTVVNTNITYTDATDTWIVSLGVTNVTDEDYLISANSNRRLGYAEGVFAREREWFLKVKRNF